MNQHLIHRRSLLAPSLARDLLVVGSGAPIPIPGGADQQYPFLAHSDYVWLTDSNEPGVVVFDPDAGWLDFAPALTEDERVWEGRTAAPERTLEDFRGFMRRSSGRSVVALGSPAGFESTAPAARVAEVRESLLALRRIKDQLELGRIREAVRATAAGFDAATRALAAGVTERALAVEIESGFFRAGADRTGYGTIVGVGSNSAVLHFVPGERRATVGDLVLIDAGAEIRRYTADVTRTLACGRPPTSASELIDIVRRALRAGVEGCRPGAEWRELHLRVALVIAEGLVQMGVLRGNPAGLVEQDAHAMFFPHGLGHLVGLGVRDASGYLPGRTRSTRPGLCFLRMDLPLRSGFVTTVEPGVYFIPALVNHPERRARYKDAVNWAKVESLIGMGGVRLEENVLVTDRGPENLTGAIPGGI